jgi:hypothetical protein
VVLLSASLVLAGPVGATSATDVGTRGCSVVGETGPFVVGVAPDARSDAVRAGLAEAGATVTDRLVGGVGFVVQSDAPRELCDVAGVRSVGPRRTIPVPEVGTPNANTNVSARNGTVLSSQREPWGITKVNATVAADAVNESSVDVAIVDSGVDADHPDLRERVVWGVNTSGDGSVRYGLSTADDDDGHGTAVAGVVGAADDGNGVVGVAPDVDLYAVRIASGDGAMRTDDAGEGVHEAVRGPDGVRGTDDDADVVVMSFGRPTSTGTQFIRDAVDRYADDTVFVASAGNSGDDNASTDEVKFPAAYDNVIAVGATDRSDEVAGFSADGPEIDVVAPGVAVTTTALGGATATQSGTSFAAPHVGGVTALLIANGSPELSTDEARRRLRVTATDVGPDGVDDLSGAGRVDAAMALGVEAPVPRPDVVVANVNGPSSVRQGDPAPFTVEFENRGDVGGNYTFDLSVDGTPQVGLYGSLAPGLTATYDTSVSFDTPGTHTVSVGNVTATVEVTTPPDVTVTDLSGPASVTDDETVTVSVSLRNDGGTVGNYSFPVVVDETRRATVSGRLAAGVSTTETVSLTLTEVGTRTVTVGGASTTVTVTGSPDVLVTSLSGPTSVAVGETATVSVGVENRGTATGSYSLPVLVDGVERQTVTGNLSAGVTTTRTVPVIFEAPGPRTVSVRTVSTTVTVTDPDSAVDVAVERPDPTIRNGTTRLNVSVRNTGDATPDTATVLATLPGDLTVTAVEGGTVLDRPQSQYLVGIGPSNTTPPGPGETRTVTFGLQVDPETAPTTLDLSFTARFDGPDGPEQTATTILDVVTPDTQKEPGLARFDTDDDGTIGVGDVVDAIVAYNADETVGGVPVTTEDVVDAIVAHNARTEV